VPTRELAAQVGEVMRNLAQALPQHPKVVVASGGVSINPQMMALRGGADVLVATPGRLLDLAKQNAIQLATVRILILDEADRLLDLGFADELARILTLLPPSRQTLLFSATFPPEVKTLVAKMLNNPVALAIEPDQFKENVIVQRAIQVDDSRRTQLLRHLLKDQRWTRVLVFVATKYAAELVAEKLYKAGVYATAFHGDLSQGARSQVLAEFKDEQWEVVITTDLAARGIDISKLPVVVNYDLPRSAVDYVHRIGRTGRAGEPGLAVSFVGADALAHFNLIQKRQGIALPLETIAGFEPIDVPTPIAVQVLPDNGGIKGKRPSKKDKLRAAADRVQVP
jgi:superfamily II DNA/RNA helicase